MHRLLGPTLAFFVLLHVTSFDGTEALSCICGISPCEVPQCCASGSYVTDACGCCPVCSEPKDSKCGGPFRTSGLCGEGLKCLRQCECKTEKSKQDCVFPFTYKGETYNKCTTVDSENGKPWCAIQLDGNGEVIKNKWEDCQEGCPGTDFECDENFLFNIEGRCVPESVTRAISPDSEALAFQIDDTEGVEYEEAPLCEGDKSEGSDGSADFQEPACRCAKNIVGSPGGRNGGCVPPAGGDPEFEDDYSFGWCFLEYVSDPSKPHKNCFDDVAWSSTEGRFWSNKACKPGAKPKINGGNEVSQVPEIIEE